MNTHRQQVASGVLRWTLGLVILWESCEFAFSAAAARHLQRVGLPPWLGAVLGGAEIVAVILFLLPKVDRIGGYSLLLIFALAAMLHVLHRQFEIGPLLVYGAAVFMCMSANGRIVPGGAS